MSDTSSTSCSQPETGDPRILRTRKLLQDAFRSLIHEKHYSEISVSDIAERATVNRATFYAHYLDKQDLSKSILQGDLKAGILKRFDHRPELSRETFAEFGLAVFEFVASLYRCAGPAATIQACDNAELQVGLTEVMEAWLSETPGYQSVFPGSSKETLATVLASSFFGGAQRWVRMDPRPPAQKICTEIAAILLSDEPS